MAGGADALGGTGGGAAGPVVLAVPFAGPWRAENSPADRVPSHGTTLFGTSHAIDLVPVGPDGRSAPRGWRSWLASEPASTFVGFGIEVRSPVAGHVVLVHDGEPDGVARRAPLVRVAYALTQVRRVERGAGAVAGNHVVVAVGPGGSARSGASGGPFVLVAHLQRGSVAVAVGDVVAAGDVVGRLGTSGNSTEPHVHLQVTDSTDWSTARGLPLTFDLGGRRHLPRTGEVVPG